ncbi:hypothetical protein MCOR17_003411 [Pyricularia oryzae]|uniref:Cytochrome P450 n=1 Tax=Pyricularia oryzae TaxID=318829 RepID=A0A4P7NSW4_PYROR|nr:hypothetical protein MCOR17_003411 [Pyricularia oryzae]QBZ64966.1 hypothetical protein PoMZ_06667 [Pyricularia oryzae]
MFSTAAIALSSTLAAWLLYRALLQKLYPSVLPGVPHNAVHAKHLLGDLPAIDEYVSKNGCTKSKATFDTINRGTTNFPIAQMLTPNIMPHAILTVDDPREVEDILRRRAKEFDRSSMTAAFFKSLLPKATISLFTTPELKVQKKLWADSITSDFVKNVVAPHAYRAANRLVELWRLKTGSEFQAQPDLIDAMMDLMWATVLGSDLGVTSSKLAATAAGIRAQDPDQLEKAASTSREMFFNVTSFLEGESSYIRAGLEPLRTRVIQFLPRYHRVRKSMNQEMGNLISMARGRRGHGRDGTEGGVACAMDLVLERELQLAEKGNSVAATNLEQELMLFMIAGIDSTAFTLAWCVKLLTKHQQIQQELRDGLVEAFGVGDNAQALPSPQDMASRDIPYLDAFIHETLRMANTAGSVVRRATTNTVVLGCSIPAGTELVLNTRVLKTPIPVDESLRSATCREAQAKRPRGGIEGPSGHNLEAFNPRRWLHPQPEGRDVFDPEALPTLVFSHGTRGCFGKRLAMLDLRVFIIVLVLEFRFMPIPENRNDWSAEEGIFRSPL